jgi:hypothetical protein
MPTLQTMSAYWPDLGADRSGSNPGLATSDFCDWLKARSPDSERDGGDHSPENIAQWLKGSRARRSIVIARIRSIEGSQVGERQAKRFLNRRKRHFGIEPTRREHAFLPRFIVRVEWPTRVIHAPFNRFHIFDKDSHPLKLKIGKYLQRHGWTRGKNPRRLNGFRDPVSPPQNAFSARCSLTATKTGSHLAETWFARTRRLV